MKYIDAEKLKIVLSDLEENHKYYNGDFHDGVVFTVDKAKEIIDSLQQEQEQYIIGGQVFGATDVNQLYEGKVYIISNLVQDTEFGLSVRDKVKMLLIKD